MDKLDWIFKKGRKAFRDDQPMPPRPAEDDTKSETFYFWIGYMLERGKVLMARLRTEDALRPDPDEPRPRKAA